MFKMQDLSKCKTYEFLAVILEARPWIIVESKIVHPRENSCYSWTWTLRTAKLAPWVARTSLRRSGLARALGWVPGIIFDFFLFSSPPIPSFQAGIGKPGTQNLARFWNSVLFQAEPRRMNVTMWRNRLICTKFQENRHIFGSTIKKIRNLTASHRTWNVTKCDENVTSYHFVTVPHSNPGPGSEKIPAWNVPDLNN